jgi:release factor glutamine methyltransferase
VTFLELVLQARETLARAGISATTVALDADLLARHASGWDLATWLTRRTEAADAAFEERYAALIERRRAREPVAYIRGTQEFWGRDFEVTPDVLIPRPETELSIEIVAALAGRQARPTIADVGTGSGCIAITLALECPAAEVWATDVSAAALAVARTNARRLGAQDRVRFVEGSYLAGVPRALDLVVSNPPYVAARDAGGLSPEVVDHEPAVALFGGADGFRDVRALLREASTALAPGGWLVMEIGYGQSLTIEDEVAAVAGLRLEELRDDVQGIQRVVVVRRSDDLVI